MVVVNLGNGLDSMEIRGRLGKPNGLGAFRCGYSELGDEMREAGIYQKRPRDWGQIFVRMVHYEPTNRQTPVQQAWRGYYKIVGSVWRGLDPSVQQSWRVSQYPYAMGGWNRFARAYLLRKPTEMGTTILGMSEIGDLTI